MAAAVTGEAQAGGWETAAPEWLLEQVAAERKRRERWERRLRRRREELELERGLTIGMLEGLERLERTYRAEHEGDRAWRPLLRAIGIYQARFGARLVRIERLLEAIDAQIGGRVEEPSTEAEARPAGERVEAAGRGLSDELRGAT